MSTDYPSREAANAVYLAWLDRCCRTAEERSEKWPSIRIDESPKLSKRAIAKRILDQI